MTDVLDEQAHCPETIGRLTRRDLGHPWIEISKRIDVLRLPHSKQLGC
jgi:hypothetical protein